MGGNSQGSFELSLNILYRKSTNSMVRHIAIFLALALFAPALFAQSDTTHPAWPTLPDRARVQHLATISSLQNYESGKGFFSAVVDFIFGSASAKHQFVQPTGVTVTRGGVLIVTDPGAQGVHIINQQEKEYSFLAGTDLGQFQSPVGCAVDGDGRVYISDSENKTIVVLNEEYDPLFQITDHIVRPTGIAVHGDRLYVTDTGQHAILVFDLTGKYLTQFGQRGEGLGELNYPIQLAVRESVLVVDALNHRVEAFDVNGHPGTSFGRLGNVAGRFASPKAIALDTDGNMYVTDAMMDCIQIFNAKGELLLVVGTHGTRNGEFMSPNGIAIGPDDRIYVVESLNRRVQIFRYIK